MKETSKVRKIAFVGDHLPRKCGIATFTSDILAAVASAHPHSQCFCVSVNDVHGGYDYPAPVRFEIEEQELSSCLRATDYYSISNVDIVCLQHKFGIRDSLEWSVLGVADAALDLALAIRVVDAAWQGDGAVVSEHVAVERVERRIVDVGFQDAFAEIVEDHGASGATQAAEGLLGEFGP